MLDDPSQRTSFSKDIPLVQTIQLHPSLACEVLVGEYFPPELHETALTLLACQRVHQSHSNLPAKDVLKLRHKQLIKA